MRLNMYMLNMGFMTLESLLRVMSILRDKEILVFISGFDLYPDNPDTNVVKRSRKT